MQKRKKEFTRQFNFKAHKLEQIKWKIQNIIDQISMNFMKSTDQKIMKNEFMQNLGQRVEKFEIEQGEKQRLIKTFKSHEENMCIIKQIMKRHDGPEVSALNNESL